MKKIGLLFILGLLLLSACGSPSDSDVELTDSAPNAKYLETLHQNIDAWEKVTMSEDEINKVVELQENGSVYYFAADEKRYIFPTPETYISWFGTQTPGRTMALEEMQDIPLGGNVTVRPGTLISTPSDPKIYLVKQGGAIAPVDNSVLKEIYGKKYEEKVLSIQNYYFTNYIYDEPITSVENYPLTIITLTIDKDKSLETDN